MLTTENIQLLIALLSAFGASGVVAALIGAYLKRDQNKAEANQAAAEAAGAWSDRVSHDLTACMDALTIRDKRIEDLAVRLTQHEAHLSEAIEERQQQIATLQRESEQCARQYQELSRMYTAVMNRLNADRAQG